METIKAQGRADAEAGAARLRNEGVAATARFRAGAGWHVIIRRWAGVESYTR